MFLATLVASTALSVATGRPSGADQLSSLQAQAAAISQQLIRQQLEVDTYRQQYSVVSARVAADSQAITAIGQQIGQDQQQIAAKVSLVRAQAVRSYMDYGTGSGSPTAALFAGDQEHAQAASEYSAIAVGNITTAVDQLHTAQAQLQAHQATLRQQQDRDRTDQASQATSLGQANASAGQLAGTPQPGDRSAGHGRGRPGRGPERRGGGGGGGGPEAGGQGRPGSARRRRSPRRCRPSRRRPRRGATSPVAVTPPAGAGADLPDPALNPFLQCVIQRESGGNYSINTGNGYYGAFQFSQSTWNIAVQAAGLSYLVGVPPSSASKAEQDTAAVALYALDGSRPWTGDCGA